MGSKRFTVNMDDFVGVLKTATLVGVSAAVAYIANNLGGSDLGPLTGVVVPIVAVALDSFMKWLKDGEAE